MTTTARPNAFLWNRISQGYARLVRESPPYASWQAWRRGGPSRDLTLALYQTPPPPSDPSPARRSSMSEEPDSTTGKDDGEVEVVEVVLEVGETAAAATGAASRGASRGNSTAIRRSATIFDDDQSMNLDSPDVRAARQLPDLSQGANQAAASTAEPGHRRLLFALDVPNGVEVTDLLCKFSRVEEVDDEHRKSMLTATYRS